MACSYGALYSYADRIESKPYPHKVGPRVQLSGSRRYGNAITCFKAAKTMSTVIASMHGGGLLGNSNPRFK